MDPSKIPLPGSAGYTGPWTRWKFANGKNVSSHHSLCGVAPFHDIITKAYLKPPSHSHKDYEDRAAFLKLDKRRGNGMKRSKKRSFQVGSTSSLSSCKDVTASNLHVPVKFCRALDKVRTTSFTFFY